MAYLNDMQDFYKNIENNLVKKQKVSIVFDDYWYD